MAPRNKITKGSSDNKPKEKSTEPSNPDEVKANKNEQPPNGEGRREGRHSSQTAHSYPVSEGHKQLPYGPPQNEQHEMSDRGYQVPPLSYWYRGGPPPFHPMGGDRYNSMDGEQGPVGPYGGGGSMNMNPHGSGDGVDRRGMYTYPPNFYYINARGYDAAAGNMHMPETMEQEGQGGAGSRHERDETDMVKDGMTEKPGKASQDQQSGKPQNNESPTAGDSDGGNQTDSSGGMNKESRPEERSREDDLEVAKTFLNLRQDGKEDQSHRVHYSDNPRSYPPQQYHPMPFQQHYQYPGMYMPRNEFPPGYFPPHISGYDAMNGQFYPPTMYHPHEMMRFPGVRGDDNYGKAGTKSPLAQDQISPSSSEMNEKSGMTLPYNSPTSTKKIAGKKGKRPRDMPRRPLSAYNFFFSEERKRVLAAIPGPEGEDKKGEKDVDHTDADDEDAENKEGIDKEDSIKDDTKRLLALRESNNSTRRPHRKTHGKISFRDLAKLIGDRWRSLGPDKREYYNSLAEKDLRRYKDQMKLYQQRSKLSFVGVNNTKQMK